MSDPTTIALFCLILFHLMLLVAIGTHRLLVTITSDKEANSFNPVGDDVSAFAVRLARVHANCYEFLPFALAGLLYAIATDNTQVTNGLAFLLVGARLAQGLIHLISTSNPAVMLRFALFLTQVLILGSWSLTFLFA
jgi:hypothetical protein